MLCARQFRCSKEPAGVAECRSPLANTRAVGIASSSTGTASRITSSGFRSSEDFALWRELVGPFFTRAPEVEHTQRGLPRILKHHMTTQYSSRKENTMRRTTRASRLTALVALAVLLVSACGLTAAKTHSCIDCR